MSPFLPEYTEHMNVPICTGVTALKTDSGEALILGLDKACGLEIGWKNH